MSEHPRASQPAVSGGTAVNWLLVILLLLMAGFLWRGQGARLGLSDLHDAGAGDKPVVARGDLAEDEKSTIALFRKASPSVVHITNLAVQPNRFEVGADALGVPRGTGSGFVWDDNGYVVTNFHVIEGADAAKVTLSDQSEWDARLVGSVPDKDVAVLKIEAPADRLHPIDVGTSANLEVGQKVFAIGNPFGLDQTLTTGVISGLGREIMSLTKRPIQGVIQTDAAINPGNSGGVLLDSAGLLIGVNTAIYSPSGTSAGIGFAVPVDPIRWIVPQLIKYGKVERIGIGVGIWGDYLTSRLGMKGVMVRTVIENGPAAKAGIRATQFDAEGRPVRAGDLIVAVNGKSVRSSIDLFRVLDQYKAGDEVQLSVEREEGAVEIPVTLSVLE